jgi:Rrf2 family transcriptional regulator, nitric oxide-sensitive transcriptional repressor
MISQTAQYALRAMVCLAMRKDSTVTGEALADISNVPPEYLSKVMQILVRGNIVTSKPGKAGGFSLRIDPAKISLQTIIDLFDSSSGDDFSLSMQSYGSPLRPLYLKLQSLQALMRKECMTTSIEDLVLR